MVDRRDEETKRQEYGVRAQTFVHNHKTRHLKKTKLQPQTATEQEEECIRDVEVAAVSCMTHVARRETQSQNGEPEVRLFASLLLPLTSTETQEGYR